MFQTVSSYGGGQSARAMSGVPSHPVDDTRMVSMGPMDPGASVKDRSLRMGSGRSEVSLPPDASSTLFVEGLPSDCTRREVSRILPLFSICNHSFTWTFSLLVLLCSLPHVIPVLLDLFSSSFVPSLGINRYLSPFCWLQRSETCKQGIKTCESSRYCYYYDCHHPLYYFSMC